MIFADDVLGSSNGARIRAAAGYGLGLCLVGAVYFGLAKLGLALASINPSATPIWPPTGIPGRVSGEHLVRWPRRIYHPRSDRRLCGPLIPANGAERDHRG